MTTSYPLPTNAQPITDASGAVSRPWRGWFERIGNVTTDGGASLTAAVGDIAKIATFLGSPDGSVDDIPEANKTVLTIRGNGSIDVSSSISGKVFVSLQGDTEILPALSFYGSVAGVDRGWALFNADNFAADTDGNLDLADLADSGTGSLLATTFDAKGRKTGSRLATTTDLTEGDNLYFTDERAQTAVVASSITDGDTTHSPSGDAIYAALALKIDTTEMASPNGVATLDSNSKLDAGQLPALAITDTFVVADEAAMLALDCQQGDVAVRTDVGQSYILTASPATTLANWQELLTPTSTVTSVFGRTGSVTAATGDYTFAQIGSTPTTLTGYGITDAEPTITAGASSQYWRGDKSWQDFATDVRAAVLTGLSTATSAVIAATDTVLSALGKLQAQISGKMDDAAVAARANSNATQSLASGAFQKVLLASEVFDSGSFYDPSTSKFTPTKAGKYMAVGSVSLTPAITAGSRIITAVAKNGSVSESATAPAGNLSTNNVQHVCMFDMNGTTDYLELYTRQDSGSSTNISNTIATSMVVYRVGA